MAIIAINVSRLAILQKIPKGKEIITLGTNNTNVPGNAAVLAEFVTAQAGLEAAEAAFEEHRQLAKELSSARDAALEAWNAKLTALAAFTESATGGDVVKIQSAGFDVRSEPSRPQPVGQIMNVVVEYTGTPGYSLVTWKREANAEAYMVQVSPEPITETSWKNMGTVTRPKYEGNGATPGQRCWYRVAGVNGLGQGVWSEPALRPVM